MNTPPSKSLIPAEGRDLSLWLAVLGAPFLYLCHHELNYILVLWACHHSKQWVLTAVSGLFLLLLVGSGAIAWRDLRVAPGMPEEAAPDVPPNRHRLFAVLGLMLAALFFLLVLAQGLATLILDPCWE